MLTLYQIRQIRLEQIDRNIDTRALAEGVKLCKIFLLDLQIMIASFFYVMGNRDYSLPRSSKYSHRDRRLCESLRMLARNCQG